MRTQQYPKQPIFYIAFWLVMITIFSCTSTPEPVSLRELKDFDSLPHSVGDSLLFSDFYSTKPRVGKGLQLVRYEARDTTLLQSILDTTRSDSVRLRAEVMLSTIKINKLRMASEGIEQLEALLNEPVQTKESSHMILMNLATYLFQEERHTESIGLAYLAKHLNYGTNIFSGNSLILIGSNLLRKDAFKNAIHIYEHAIDHLSNGNFDERINTLILNLSIAYLELKQYDKAAQHAKKALKFDSTSVHIKNKLTQIYSHINTDSAFYYNNSSGKTLNKYYSIERDLQIANLYLPLQKHKAKSIFSKLYRKIKQTPKDNFMRIEIIHGLYQSTNYSTDSLICQRLQEQVDSIIINEINSFNTETHEHYLDYYSEICMDRITKLLTLPSTTKTQLIIRELNRHHYCNHTTFLNNFKIMSNQYDILKRNNIYTDKINTSTNTMYTTFGLQILPQINLNNYFKGPTPFHFNENNKQTLPDNIGKLYIFEIANKSHIIHCSNTKDTIITITDHINDSLHTNKIQASLLVLINASHIRNTTIITLNPLSEKLFMASDNRLHKTLLKHTLPIYTSSATNEQRINDKISIESSTAIAYTDIEDLDISDKKGELPGGFFEAEYIKKVYPNTNILLSNQASSVNIQNSLNNHDLIHISLHGAYNKMNKYLVGLITKSDKYPIITQEVERPKLQLVILLSCNSTKGPAIPSIGQLSAAKILAALPYRLVITSNQTYLRENESFKLTKSIYSIIKSESKLTNWNTKNLEQLRIFI